MKTGDIVRHRPLGEEWVVAYVDGDRLAWVGWPPGQALVTDCELVEECSVEESERLLRQLADSKGGPGDKRVNMARRLLGERV